MAERDRAFGFAIQIHRPEEKEKINVGLAYRTAFSMSAYKFAGNIAGKRIFRIIFYEGNDIRSVSRPGRYFVGEPCPAEIRQTALRKVL